MQNWPRLVWPLLPCTDEANVCVNTDLSNADLPITANVPNVDLPANSLMTYGSKSDSSVDGYS